MVNSILDYDVVLECPIYSVVSLKWLKTTKSAYLKTINSSLAEFMNIELIPEELPLEKKCNVIINYIEGERKNGNR